MTNLEQLKPFHNPSPSDFIQEEMDERGWTQEDLADVLGYSVQTINKLLKNKQSITVDLAKALGKAFEQTPQYWMNLDTIYRLHLEGNHQKDIEVETRAKIYESMPINEMAKKKWINKGKSVTELVQNLERFFKKSEGDDLFTDNKAMPTFRKSEAFEGKFDGNAATCWFQMAKNLSETIEVPNYNKDLLEDLVKKVHLYTIKENGVGLFLEELNKCGVKFLVLSHLSKTFIDGAAFFDGQSPVIVYTARYKRLDNFWFTTTHEIGHVLLHLIEQLSYFIDREGFPLNNIEKEANEFAGKALLYSHITQTFGTNSAYITSQQIKVCGQRLSLHPSIIVGALAHHQSTYYKRISEFNEDPLSLIPDKYQVEKFL
jgi:HTH-type transcriptional regulator / antitoxin HigA